MSNQHIFKYLSLGKLCRHFVYIHYIHLISLLLNSINAQTYIQSDISQSGTIEFARYTSGITFEGTTDQSSTKTANFQTQFVSNPQILIGIIFLDLGTTNLRTAFKFSVSSVSTNQVAIKFDKYGVTQMFGTKISYFAILDSDVKIYSLTLNYNTNSDITIRNNESHNFVLPTKIGRTINVQCYFIGFESTYQIEPSLDSSMPYRNLEVQTQIDSSNSSFKIIVTATDLATNLHIIYVNCMEYYVEQASDYSMISNVQTTSSPITISASSSYASQSHTSNINPNFSGSSISSFIGIQQMDISQDDAIRIEYYNFSYSSNIFYFSMQTWSSSIVKSSKVTFFHHQMLDCKTNSNKINSGDQKQCVSSCPDGQYSASYLTTNVCRPCNSVCKTCIDGTTCASCQPHQYLSTQSHLCVECSTNCLTCSNTATQCLTCPPGKYLFKNTCYDTKPPGTYCDQNLVCLPCSGLCNDCDSTLINCYNCLSQSQYLLNQRCTISQPSNSYCPTPSTCQQCLNSNCEQCSQNLYSCTKCPMNWYFFERDQDCYQQKPPGSYCQQYNCITCLSNCNSCSSNLYTCLSCLNNQYLLNGICYIDQPSSTYCDSNKICNQCQNSSCDQCGSSLSSCLKCKAGYFYYNGQCYNNCANLNQYFLNGNCSNTQPPNTYCNSQKICTQCPAECDGCNFNLSCNKCSDPNQFWYQGKCTITQPGFTFCESNAALNIQNYCLACHPSCRTCTGSNQNQCTSCQDGFNLENSSCFCANQEEGYNPKTQQCESCFVKGCTQCKSDISKCEICDSLLLLDKNTGVCYCPNEGQFLSSFSLTCLKNSIPNCKVSSRFENKCIQCMDGYLNFNNQLCSYCGKSKYTNSQNQCVNSCIKGCIICTDDKNCLLKEDDISGGNNNGQILDNNNSQLCNYSCGICNGSESTNCLTCSSSTRKYSIIEQTCTCKSGYQDVGKADCEQLVDLSQSYYAIVSAVFIIFMITQLPFVPFNSYHKFNYNFSVIQLIALLSYDHSLNSSLNYTNILKLFQNLGITTIIPTQFINHSNAQVKLYINQILLLSFFQAASLVSFIIQTIIQKPKLNYFNKQILFCCNRFTSTINISLIFIIFLEHLHEINNTILILVFISSAIQLILTLLILKNIYSEYQNFSPYREKTITTLSMNQSMRQSILGDDSNSCLIITNNFYVIEGVFELRRILNGLIIAFLKQSTISYQIVSFLAVLSILQIIYIKPFKNYKNNLLISIIELFSSTSFLLHSFYKKDLTNSFNQYYLLFIVFSITIAQSIAIIQSLGQIFLTIYNKIKQISFGSQNCHKNVELVPSSLAKEQIDNILEQKRWDFHVFSSRQYKGSLFQVSSKKI